jgi:hypothetical protein
MNRHGLTLAIALAIAAPADARVYHFQPKLWVTLDGHHYVLSPSPGIDFFGPIAMPLNYATGPNLKDCHRPNNAPFGQGTALWYTNKGPLPLVFPAAGWSFQPVSNGEHRMTIASPTGDVICANASATAPPPVPPAELLKNSFE